MALTVAQSTQRKRRHGKTGDSAPQPAKPLKKVKAPLQLVIPTDDEETDNDGIPLLGVPETNNFDNEIKIMEFQEHKIAEQDIANDIIQLLQASLDIGTSDEDKLSGSDSKIKEEPFESLWPVFTMAHSEKSASTSVYKLHSGRIGYGQRIGACLRQRGKCGKCGICTGLFHNTMYLVDARH
ncbi:hypothetical protein PSHT_13236 [Puccinia striiformis]|uniref:Uncharacterized protein n=1 Tax=Puccinia striiformis TaxID=27350 RepID=A0A2S4US24_9BASI|nr:hypothetical protein PSHT_13236 [Puccinia striiformis]